MLVTGGAVRTVDQHGRQAAHRPTRRQSYVTSSSSRPTATSTAVYTTVFYVPRPRGDPQGVRPLLAVRRRAVSSSAMATLFKIRELVERRPVRPDVRSAAPVVEDVRGKLLLTALDRFDVAAGSRRNFPRSAQASCDRVASLNPGNGGTLPTGACRFTVANPSSPACGSHLLRAQRDEAVPGSYIFAAG
jgi:hypothetical protein